MSTTEVTLKIFLSSLLEYGLISKVVLHYISLMFRRYLDLIKFSFRLQCLCHFSDCAFAATETEEKKARLRRTYRHHQSMMLLSLNQLYVDHSWQQFISLVFNDRDAAPSLAWSSSFFSFPGFRQRQIKNVDIVLFKLYSETSQYKLPVLCHKKGVIFTCCKYCHLKNRFGLSKTQCTF